MNFHPPQPCCDCPFRRVRGIRLGRARIKEIVSQGHAFHCHKTASLDEDDRLIGKALHCTGALIFAEKQGSVSQIVRIMERIGCYDSERLMASAAVGEVFDTEKEMLGTAI
jgi:hypothetical protein